MAKPEKRKDGCLKKLMLLVTIGSAGVLLVAMLFMVLPQDLSDVQGYRDETSTEKARDLHEVLKNAVDRRYQVTLSEAEINRWLADTIEIEQKGLLADHVKMSAVCIRLKEGVAEVIIERTVFGQRTTQSMFIQFKQTQGATGLRTEVLLHDGPFHAVVPYLRRGGQYGRLVVPQGYIYLVQPAYTELANVCRDEIRLAFEEMAGISIEEDRLVLNPNGAVNSEPVTE